ncbi:MAG: VCBS repeat-containing protein [Armatimonadota bacterium]|nr:VCBS repeat-containing protein [Armatimonadota bacterium]
MIRRYTKVGPVILFILLTAADCSSIGTAAVTKKPDLSRFVPNGYQLVRSAEGDLNGDGQKDVALAVQARDINYGSESRLAKIIVLFRQGNNLRKAWQHWDRYSYLIGEGEGPVVNKHTIEIGDFNGDGTKEIAFRMTNMGASDGTISIRVFSWGKGRFLKLLELQHPLEGGVKYQAGNTFAPGKAVMVYQMIWADKESHADPHRYEGEYYRWNPKARKYECYKKVETKAKGERGLRELHSITKKLWS